MLTKIVIRNFKRFRTAEIELGNPVVLVGPNNSGKTTALQALALWDIGLRRWNERRQGKEAPEKRPGVAINRRDLIAVPVPDAILLWRGLHVRDVQRISGKQSTQNVRIDIVVEGVTDGRPWACGLEFDFANEESIYCRPLRAAEGKDAPRMPIPSEAGGVRLAFLPPMSGLAANETRIDPGAINVRLGEGRTAEVLRNLCYQILTGSDGNAQWRDVCESIHSLFGVSLDSPTYLAERGEIVMTYREPSGVRLDLSSSGRGLQQTLLLLAHMTANPGAVLLLDEPDAHLEILRQRQIYQLLSDTARAQGSQIIAASHSEVLLNEAADRDVIVAFVGTPHRIDDRGQQVGKSLREIGFEEYYQAQLTGWVLYLEGATDLAILQAFAKGLRHEAYLVLERPFVHYVGNQPTAARKHFYGLREAKLNLTGVALFDRTAGTLQQRAPLRERMWKRYEIENYLCSREVLIAWAEAEGTDREGGPLFGRSWADHMSESIDRIEDALSKLKKPSPWSGELKVSDEFLDPIFAEFFTRLGLPNLMRKTDYHRLARFVRSEDIDPEVREVLDEIVAAAAAARPLRDKSGDA